MGTVELKDSQWRDFIQTEYAVIDCYGDQCVACVMLAPHYDAVADELNGIRFGRVNITQHPDIAEAFGIMSMPTLLFFRKGEKVHESSGSMEREELLSHVAKLLYE